MDLGKGQEGQGKKDVFSIFVMAICRSLWKSTGAQKNTIKGISHRVVCIFLNLGEKKNPLSLQKLPFSALFCVLFLFVIEPGPPRPAREPLGLLVLVIELKKKPPKNHMGIRAGEGMKEEIIGGIHGWISYCPN